VDEEGDVPVVVAAAAAAAVRTAATHPDQLQRRVGLKRASGSITTNGWTL
jgi:hypothetical protein